MSQYVFVTRQDVLLQIGIHSPGLVVIHDIENFQNSPQWQSINLYNIIARVDPLSFFGLQYKQAHPLDDRG